MFWFAINIREITAAAAGDENLLADTIGVLQHRDTATALASLQRAHQSGGASAENQGIIGFNRVRAQGINVPGVRRQINTGGTIATCLAQWHSVAGDGQFQSRRTKLSPIVFPMSKEAFDLA